MWLERSNVTWAGRGESVCHTHVGSLMLGLSFAECLEPVLSAAACLQIQSVGLPPKQLSRRDEYGGTICLTLLERLAMRGGCMPPRADLPLCP